MIRLSAFIFCMLCTSLVFAVPAYVPTCYNAYQAFAITGQSPYWEPGCAQSGFANWFWLDMTPTMNNAALVPGIQTTVNSNTSSINTLNTTTSTHTSQISTLQSQVAALQADLATRTTADQGDQLISIMQYLGMGIATFLGFATRIA